MEHTRLKTKYASDHTNAKLYADRWLPSETMTFGLAQAALMPAPAPVVDHLSDPDADPDPSPPYERKGCNCSSIIAREVSFTRGKKHKQNGEQGFVIAVLRHCTAYHPQ